MKVLLIGRIAGLRACVVRPDPGAHGPSVCRFYHRAAVVARLRRAHDGNAQGTSKETRGAQTSARSVRAVGVVYLGPRWNVRLCR